MRPMYSGQPPPHYHHHMHHHHMHNAHHHHHQHHHWSNTSPRTKFNNGYDDSEWERTQPPYHRDMEHKDEGIMTKLRDQADKVLKKLSLKKGKNGMPPDYRLHQMHAHHHHHAHHHAMQHHHHQHHHHSPPPPQRLSTYQSNREHRGSRRFDGSQAPNAGVTQYGMRDNNYPSNDIPYTVKYTDPPSPTYSPERAMPYVQTQPQGYVALLVFDFDQTLTVQHLHQILAENPDELLTFSDSTFGDAECLKQSIPALIEAGVGVAIATFGTRELVMMALDFLFQSKQYISESNILDYRDVGNISSRKNEMLKALSTQYNVPLKDTIFVDDDIENLVSASKLGVTTVNAKPFTRQTFQVSLCPWLVSRGIKVPSLGVL